MFEPHALRSEIFSLSPCGPNSFLGLLNAQKVLFGIFIRAL